MLIKVIKCSNPNHWYNKYIGEVFNVFKLNHHYVIESNSVDLFVIECDDAIPFNREEKIQKILDNLK